MSHLIRQEQRRTGGQQSGFSLIELLIATVILLAVSGIVLTGMYQMAMRQASIESRAEMHSGVRSVTEVLQQEISQAGRIAFPSGTPTTTMNVSVSGASTDTPVTMSAGVADPALIFDNMQLIIDIGDNEEVLTATNWNGTTFTGTFERNHPINALVRPAGAFGEGILPSSTGTVLKMFGDINDNGNLVYVEYTCDFANSTLWRQELAWDDPVSEKTNPTDPTRERQALLTNLLQNPPLPDNTPVPCFTYQQDTEFVNGSNMTFTLNVGVTLTASPERPDPQTGRQDPETKALLNVSPRNVFQGWQLAGTPGGSLHVQPTPPEITNLAQ